MAADHFCLRWNNYQSNMVSELDSLRANEVLVDVTISCEGRLMKAHKVILSACSSYFRNVFKENPCKHPVVILKNVSYEDVDALLSFVYQGVVYISEKKLSSFLQTAELLQIRGLAGAALTMKDDNIIPTTNSGMTTTSQRDTCSFPPPPPQLIAANPSTNWKPCTLQQLQPTLILPPTFSPRKSIHSPPSPSSLTSTKRRKTTPNKVVNKETWSESSDTNSNQEISEPETDMLLQPHTVKHEILSDTENSIADENSKDGSRTTTESNAITDEIDATDVEDELSIDMTDSNNPLSTTDSSSPAIDVYAANSAAGDYNLMTTGYPVTTTTTTIPTSTEQTTTITTVCGPEQRLGARPCPSCKKIISNKSNLLKHMRIRHSNEENPEAECKQCNKIFKNRYSLRAHVNTYHRGRTPPCIAHSDPGDRSCLPLSPSPSSIQTVTPSALPLDQANYQVVYASLGPPPPQAHPHHIAAPPDFSSQSLTLHNVAITTNHTSNILLSATNHHHTTTNIIPATMNEYSQFSSIAAEDLPSPYGGVLTSR